MIWLVVFGVAIVALCVLDFLDDLAGCLLSWQCCAFGSRLLRLYGWLFSALLLLRFKFWFCWMIGLVVFGVSVVPYAFLTFWMIWLVVC